MSQLSPLYTSPSKLAVTVSTNHTQTLIRKCYLMMTSSLITMSLCTWKCCFMITNVSTFYSCCTSGIKMSFTNQALTAGFLHPTTSFRLSSLTLAVFLCLFFDFVPFGSCPADEASCTSSFFFLSASPLCLVVINSGLPLLETYLCHLKMDELVTLAMMTY